jgi:hypothetical protein
MQEAPAPAILSLNSTPDSIIDGNPGSSAATAGTCMPVVIILMSPAKSSHESPAGKEQMNQEGAWLTRGQRDFEV